MLKQSFRSIGVMLQYARKPTLLTLALMLAQSFEAPLSIFFTSRLINSIGPFMSGAGSAVEVVKWTALLLGIMLFAANSGLFTGLMEIYSQRALNKNMTGEVLRKFRRLDYMCFENPDVLNTLERMGKEPHMRLYALYKNTVDAVSTLISLMGTAIVFTQVSAWFALVYFVLLAPLLWFDFKDIEARQRLWNTEMPNWRRRTYLSALMADKHAMFELKLFDAIKFILAKWKRIADDFRREYVRLRLKSSKYGIMHVLMLSAWAAFVILSMIYGLSGGTVNLGTFVACITSMGTILTRSSAMSAAFSQVSQDCLEMKHFDIFMSLPEIPQDAAAAIIDSPSVEFRDVTFSYPGAKEPVLKSVSFSIAPGERLALVGENGAGKSTIVRLLCGLYRPDGGGIYINDISVGDISQSSLRSVFSVVFQDFCNYEMTLRENVAFGSIDKLSDDIAINQALSDGLWTEEMPLDANLGKLEHDGVDLSGGQWQKVAIARALVSDSAYIILDEPTASLDPLAECRMYETFQSILRNRGCVMISHRLASARLADRIIVLDGGKVVQSGGHEELVSREGLYNRMWTAQSAWYA
ncbi:MAG: ABC transporter ATP-binding protein/permease [Oscillospiraceae bacterium]|nr:ABC transporter ATP-binding protein/permease [Oscillospiraceae bacterium]